jgi:hypothetical protein
MSLKQSLWVLLAAVAAVAAQLLIYIVFIADGALVKEDGYFYTLSTPAILMQGVMMLTAVAGIMAPVAGLIGWALGKERVALIIMQVVLALMAVLILLVFATRF